MWQNLETKRQKNTKYHWNLGNNEKRNTYDRCTLLKIARIGLHFVESLEYSSGFLSFQSSFNIIPSTSPEELFTAITEKSFSAARSTNILDIAAQSFGSNPETFENGSSAKLAAIQSTVLPTNAGLNNL